MSEYIQYDQLFARVYTSETGTWGNIIVTEAACYISRKPAVLVGNCLYRLSMSIRDGILEFDMSEHSLTLIGGPPVRDDVLFGNRHIIQAEDGVVGCAILSFTHFEMWQRNVNGRSVTTWVLWKTIEMHAILRLPSLHEEMYVHLLGYDEDDVVFLCYGGRVYMVQLKTMQSKKLNKIHYTRNRYFPFKSFFTPGDCSFLVLIL
jgi:hypothetical protein